MNKTPLYYKKQPTAANAPWVRSEGICANLHQQTTSSLAGRDQDMSPPLFSQHLGFAQPQGKGRFVVRSGKQGQAAIYSVATFLVVLEAVFYD